MELEEKMVDDLGPEEQIRDVRECLERLRALPPGTLRDLELRDAEAYLRQLQALAAEGDLTPLPGHLTLLSEEEPQP